MMTRDKKRSLHNKAKRYDQLDKVFSRIIEGINKVLSDCDPIIFKPIENNKFSGFGQTISFSWRYIFVEDLTLGEMNANHLKDDTTNPFFTRYFDPKGRIYSMSKESPEHYVEDHEQMEELLFMILDDFYKLDCFKAQHIDEGLAETE